MITVDLDKEDLVNLVCGIQPHYVVMIKYIHLGRYNGSQDEWKWNRTTLNKLEESTLLETYQICKNSWK